MTEPLIRPFVAGDEAGIIDLYRVVFGLELTVDEWRWYYGRDALIVVATVDRKIVGHYAVQPRAFFVGEQPCQAGLVMGSMVAPEFRNITTFIEMAKLAYTRCREQTIAFVYAFPNDNVWLVRRRMLDWQALPSINALAAAVTDLAVSDDTTGVELLAPGQAFPDAPWLARSLASNIRSADTASFLSWRLCERPRVDYPVYVHREAGRLRGYIALKRFETRDRITGHIVAFRVEPGAEQASGGALLARAKAHFEASGVERVSLWLLPASPLHPLVLAAGANAEPPPGKHFGYLAFDEELAPALADPARWDIAMSDSDVF